MDYVSDDDVTMTDDDEMTDDGVEVEADHDVG